MEDSRIVSLYWQRSDRAIEETAAKYGAYCRTIAYNLLHDSEDAEECVNDTYLGAWNSMPQNRPERLAPYLGRITRSLSISRVRERTRAKRGGGEYALALEELADCIPAGEGPEQFIEAKELEQAIDSFLEGLGEMERNIFLSRYWYMAPLDQIAKRAGFSLSKTKSILYRSRQRLLQRLKEEGLC